MSSTASCNPHVLDKRDASDLTPNLAEALDVVTAHTSTLPVGTFKYKVFKYPGDVDIFEQLSGCCQYNKTKVGIAKEIQSIVKNIQADSKLIYVEFKAGYDLRFKIYTGVVNDTVEDYSPQIIRRDVSNLRCAGLLSQCEYEEIMNLIVDNPTAKDVMILNEHLRSYWVLRWTAEEVIVGHKILPGDIHLFLDEAITHGSVVKLDTIAQLEDRYVEVTNFFVIKQQDRYGNEKILSEELKDYAQSLAHDVYKYYDSNTLKAVKRFWMYLSFKGHICELDRFTPLFEGDLARASQVVADLEVAITLLESSYVYDDKFLYASMGKRLSGLMGTYLHEPIRSSNKSEILSYFKHAREELFNKVNVGTKAWLKANNINIIDMLQKGY